MLKGDLSNVVSPRLLVVFENLIAEIPSEKQKDYDTALRKKKWKQATAHWTVSEMLARKAWDLTWRLSVSLDAITWMDEELAELVEPWMDNAGLPFRRVITGYSPQALARQIAVMPDVAAIYDPDPTHRFMYGAKGRFLTPDQYNALGAF